MKYSKIFGSRRPLKMFWNVRYWLHTHNTLTFLCPLYIEMCNNHIHHVIKFVFCVIYYWLLSGCCATVNIYIYGTIFSHDVRNSHLNGWTFGPSHINICTHSSNYFFLFFLIKSKLPAINFRRYSVHVIRCCNSLLTSIELFKCKKASSMVTVRSVFFSLSSNRNGIGGFNRFVRHLNLLKNSSSALVSQEIHFIPASFLCLSDQMNSFFLL